MAKEGGILVQMGEQFVGSFASFIVFEDFLKMVWEIGEWFCLDDEKDDFSTKRMKKARRTHIMRSLRLRASWVFGLIFYWFVWIERKSGKFHEKNVYFMKGKMCIALKVLGCGI